MVDGGSLGGAGGRKGGSVGIDGTLCRLLVEEEMRNKSWRKAKKKEE